MTTLFDQPPDVARFDGPEPDEPRLTGQIERVWNVARNRVSNGGWFTVDYIVQRTGFPANSVQAQLRNLRKARFGAYLVERRRSAEGLYEYRVGNKGEGIPQHSRCNHCEVLEAEIERLQGLLASRMS